MRLYMLMFCLIFCGLLCVIELAVAAPIVTAGFAYRGGPFFSPHNGLPHSYYADASVPPSLYPANPYPLGFSYGYGFGSFTLTPFIF